MDRAKEPISSFGAVRGSTTADGFYSVNNGTNQGMYATSQSMIDTRDLVRKDGDPNSARRAY